MVLPEGCKKFLLWIKAEKSIETGKGGHSPFGGEDKRQKQQVHMSKLEIS